MIKEPEKYQLEQERALKNIKLAEHMLSVTYPFVKDPKMLLTIIENIFLAMTSAMGSLLYLDRLYKQIPPFHKNFESKIYLFENVYLKKLSLNSDHLLAMKDLKEIILLHRQSKVEFSKGGEFIICSDQYDNLRKINQKTVSDYLEKAKIFIEQITNIVEEKRKRIRLEKNGSGYG